MTAPLQLRPLSVDGGACSLDPRYGRKIEARLRDRVRICWLAVATSLTPPQGLGLLFGR